MTAEERDEHLPGRHVDTPLPPELAEAFGYPGCARFVGFRYDGDLDDLIFDDGVCSGNAATWVFQTYRRHKTVGALLEGAGIGLEGRPATHWLLLDRQQGRASLAPTGEARRFLQAQHPAQPELSPEQAQAVQAHLDEALAEGWHEVGVDPEEIHRSMQEQRARVGRMVSWLDQCPIPPRPGRGTPPAGEGR